jgi:hypothetical protein
VILSGFPTRNLYEFYLSPLRAIRSTYLIIVISQCYQYLDRVNSNLWFLLLDKTFSGVLVSETQRNSVLEMQTTSIQSILTVLDKR